MTEVVDLMLVLSVVDIRLEVVLGVALDIVFVPIRDVNLYNSNLSPAPQYWFTFPGHMKVHSTSATFEEVESNTLSHQHSPPYSTPKSE